MRDRIRQNIHILEGSPVVLGFGLLDGLKPMELSPSPCFATRRTTTHKELPAPETPTEQEVVEQIEDLWAGSVRAAT